MHPRVARVEARAGPVAQCYRSRPMAPRDPTGAEDPLLRAFRQRVRETMARDLERERAEAEALRSEVLCKLRDAIGAERGRGECTEVWLFGSFAWGTPTERSDVDLLVKGCKNPDGLAGRLWLACGRPAHVLDFATAPQSLVDRAMAEGLAL